jgi:hypothetical protein
VALGPPALVDISNHTNKQFNAFLDGSQEFNYESSYSSRPARA